MSKTPSIGSICLLLSGLVIIAPLAARADDKTTLPPPTAGDGYRLVPIHSSDGKISYVRVADQPKPTGNLNSDPSDGKYDPSSINLSKTSSWAGKSFAVPSFAQNDSAEVIQEQNFITKSYFAANGTPPAYAEKNFDTKAAYPQAQGYDQTAPDAGKSFTSGTGADTSLTGKTAQFATNSTTADDQNRTANIGGKPIPATPSPLANKTYTGPEADLEHKSMAEMNQGLMQMKDLPNRPLTIDEVRALINHGVKPDLDTAPPPATKPLNDPDYKPEATPAPPDDSLPPAPINITPSSTHAAAPAADSDSSDGDLPAPGEVAASHSTSGQTPPENSEPLPTK